jgi:C4-dicarboxylate transporter, DctQ subunit
LSRRVSAALRTVAALYRRLLELLAVIAGVLLAAMALAIVVDVVLRNLGLQPPAHTLTLTEYGLLYVTMLAAPWLVREKGHVHIELLTAAVGPRARFWLTRAVYALCVLTCIVIFWFGLEVTIDQWQRAVIDVRSFDMPRWLLTGSIPLSFGLMTIEFARFLFGLDSMHSGHAGIHE